jgi:elongation factor P
MISTADFANGVAIEVDGAPYIIIWFQHHKPGKGGAVMRVKLQNLRTGAIIERTFKSGEKFREINIERRKKQYLYNDGQNYYFMDTETFDQIHLPKTNLGRAVDFLKPETIVEAIYLDEEFVSIELPATVDLRVKATVPGVKGDTVSNVMKPATVETGAEVQVPLFIKEGDIVKINTRTGEYVSRVNE